MAGSSDDSFSALKKISKKSINLPKQVPSDFLTSEEAKLLNYHRISQFRSTMDCLVRNRAIEDFGYAEIKETKQGSFRSFYTKMGGFIFILRMVLIQLVLVAACNLPLLALSIFILFELAYLPLVCYHTLRSVYL